MRVAISLKLSPPGNRNPDGLRCTAFHSGSFRSFDSSAPVHSPKSHSSRPLSTVTFSSSAFAIGAAVSRVRCSGDAYTATTPLRPARCSATAWACAWPLSARGRPAARPGQDLAGRRRLAVTDEDHHGGRRRSHVGANRSLAPCQSGGLNSSRQPRVVARRDRALPRLPTSGCVARTSRGREASVVRRRDVLGPTGTRFRRSAARG